MKKKESAYLFIDGTNLYAGQYELFGPEKYLDFGKFIQEIQESLTVQFEKILFYASYSPKPGKPTRKQKAYLKNEGLFYKRVRDTKGVTFFRGYRSPTSGKEKEVDVQLAVDIVHLAHLNRFNTLFLFSGDADFMHVLQIAESLQKNVRILAIENRIPRRFTFNYQTILCLFSSGKSLKLEKSQKISMVKLAKENLLQGA